MTTLTRLPQIGGLDTRDFDQLLGRLFNGDGNAQLAPYPVDIREDQNHLYVEAELPGFKKEEIEITLENQTLTISGQRGEQPAATEGEKPEVLLNERRYHKFLRSFKLPQTVDGQAVNAKLVDGVLTVTLNKREESKPRKIAVS